LRGSLLFLAFFSILLIAAFASCQRVHRGSLTGPFVIGTASARAEMLWPVPVAPDRDSPGYDGQFFLALSLDPFFRGELSTALDNPRYRARRMTWPLAAWLLGFGRPAWVVWALYLVNAAVIAAGGCLISLRAREHGLSQWWGLAFVLALGTLVCVSRMLSDAVMVGLLAAALSLWKRGNERAMAGGALLCALAVLQKETALLALPGFWWGANRRARRMLLLCLALPLSWWVFVHYHLPASNVSVLDASFALPGVGLWRAMVANLGAGRGLARLAKDVGFLTLHALAIVAGLRIAVKVTAARSRNLPLANRGLAVSVGLFAALGLAMAYPLWMEPWGYSRTLLPLFVLLLFSDFELLDETTPWCFAGRALLAADATAGVLFFLKNLILRTP
jgi:hypothetical protein